MGQLHVNKILSVSSVDHLSHMSRKRAKDFHWEKDVQLSSFQIDPHKAATNWWSKKQSHKQSVTNAGIMNDNGHRLAG